MLDVTSFKGIFNVAKRSAAKKFNRREAKVDQALDQLYMNIQTLKQIDYDTTRYEKIYDRLMNQVLDAEYIGSTDPRKAYKMLEDVKEKARSAVAASLQESQDQKLAPLTRVQIEGLGEVQLHPQSIPGYAELKPEALKQMAEVVGKKVGDGKQLYDALVSGEGELPPPNLKSAADLMWYVRVMAEAKAGEAFAKGAVTLPDPDLKLRRYLDKVAEVYRRDSSHLKETQSEWHGQARGIDFYEGSLQNPDSLLPYGMKTMLTQSIDTPEGRVLYVKMETEGARVNPVRKFHDHDESPENRDWKLVDVGRSILHLINLLRSHQDGTLASFREQTPKAIADAYAKALAAASKEGDKEVKALLKRGHKFARRMIIHTKKKDQGNSIRVTTIMQNFEELNRLVESRKSMQIATADSIVNAMLKCVEEIIELFGDESSSLKKRFGGEIQLNQEDMERTDLVPRQQDEEEIDGELQIEQNVGRSDLLIDEVEDDLDDLDFDMQELQTALDQLTRNYR